MKKLLLILLFLPFIGFGQQTVGLFKNDTSSYNGYTIFNTNNSSVTYLIDNCGNLVHSWQGTSKPNLSVYLLENGNLLRTQNNGVELLDFQSNIIWSYANPLLATHHDIEPLPNGNILILCVEDKNTNEILLAGGTDSLARQVDFIVEINPFNNQIVWEWHVWDHLVQDIDSLIPNYGNVSNSPHKMDVNYVSNNNNNPIQGDWLHANSLDYNSDLDQIIINFARTNEFWIIDHSTTTLEAESGIGGYSGKGGDILYRWGNPRTYNMGSISDQIFEFQHDVHWISDGLVDEGRIMIFNNGRQRGFSSIDIIEPPINANNFNNYDITPNLSYGPNNLYWTYSDSANFFSHFISGVQRLPNGNTLICSGATGRFFEIEYLTDSLVWEYINPVIQTGPVYQGDVIPIANSTPNGTSYQNSTFRAHRYSPNYSAFNNVNLTVGIPIEINPIVSDCDIYLSGCVDSLACNYDPIAIIFNGSCIYNSLSYDTLISSISLSWNGLILTVSGDYSVTLINSAGCDSIVNLNLTVNTTGISDIDNNRSKLVKITDMLGQETPFRRNITLFYIYDDGTVEKIIVVE
jgi:hypothetical protein